MEGTVGEIRMVAFKSAPDGWLLCDGALYPMGDQLSKLIGKQYGGDGITNYAVPNLQGKLPVGVNTGNPGGIAIMQGQNMGMQSLALTPDQIMMHTHSTTTVSSSVNGSLLASSSSGDTSSPAGGYLISNPGNYMYSPGSALMVQSHAMDVEYNDVWSTGDMANNNSGQPHNNDQPYLCINFIICAQGEYPQF